MTTSNHQRKLKNNQWVERIVLGGLFILLGALIIVVFSPYRPVFTGFKDTLGRILLCVMLLLTALIARKISRLKPYWHLLFGFFILALAVSVDYWAAGFMQNAIRIPANTPSALALEKIKSASIAALIVLLLTKLSGESFRSLYIQKGKLGNSLIIGFITFSIAAAGAVPMSQLLFSGKAVDLGELVKWLPWILLFVLCNAFFEELLFRGLFLRKLEPFLGKMISNSLIVLVFTGLHLGVTYTRDQMLFLIILVPLAFLWGYIMQKTETIWGSVLFHAGMDLPIIIALFSNLD